MLALLRDEMRFNFRLSQSSPVEVNVFSSFLGEIIELSPILGNKVSRIIITRIGFKRPCQMNERENADGVVCTLF